ncbi:hypothetical protein [Thermoactinospora rubra]|uniref:hypothetical protein n=1 Tax=Thermoactinospora rubra TaxID=1088767 RepID=UPI000A11648F|nr:hypothetical protein [Thermoactinospora rubra]
MTGRHRRTGELTEPMPVVRPTAPPIDPEPETATMPALTPADVAEWERLRKEITDPDEWLAPLRTGGTRVEHRMRQTMRERGLLLAKRVSRRARRLRAALWKGERG